MATLFCGLVAAGSLTLFVASGAPSEPAWAAQDVAVQDDAQALPDPGDAAGERYIVKFRDSGESVRASVRAQRGRIVLDMPGRRLLAARLSACARDAVERDPQLEFVEVDQKRYPLAGGPPWGNIPAGEEILPYGIQMVQADQLSDAASSTARRWPRRTCQVWRR